MKKSIMIIAALMATTGYATAKKATTPRGAPGVQSIAKLIDIAGRQRMLSQRIAKDYLYKGKKVATVKAKKQLKASLSELLAAHGTLVESINDEEIHNLLEFVKMSSEDFEAIVKMKFSKDNAQLIIDLSESMLEGSQYVVDSLTEKSTVAKSKIVGTAGRQRMLAQRISKYYIAYQIGIRDSNTIEQMKEAVKAFSDAHEALKTNQGNTPEINRKLNAVDRLWKIVHKFYLGIEKGGLPLIVFTTTDKITKEMNEITGLYVKLAQ